MARHEYIFNRHEAKLITGTTFLNIMPGLCRPTFDYSLIGNDDEFDCRYLMVLET